MYIQIIVLQAWFTKFVACDLSVRRKGGRLDNIKGCKKTVSGLLLLNVVNQASDAKRLTCVRFPAALSQRI